ncbi:MAG: ATP-binding protein [Phycisphaerales bacterium]|nr:MAG: ATP-binding protein [Phycisphaerales bacterium]
MTTVASRIPAEDLQDLSRIIEAYSEVTERLKHSHELLSAEVCRLRQQLAEKNKELARRERLAALGEMAAGVAHEIRNPLAAMELYVSLLERDLQDEPSKLAVAHRVATGIRNLECIVRDTLSFAHSAEPEFRAVPAMQIIERVVTQAMPQADALSAAIEVDDRFHEVMFWCDAAQIERALMNLVYNALDACGGEGHIRLVDGGRSEDGRFAQLVIEDDGGGIPEELLDRIFNPFFTTKHSGTGLGLAIVHRILEAHGGWVRAGNHEGGGAAFAMGVPVATGEVIHRPADKGGAD